jgi:8-oxo-dGTP pyrophosphatase MutT (NUDIX family)
MQQNGPGSLPSRVRRRKLMWKPNVTVAAVVQRNGRFLLVEEETERGRLFNQPAGHLDPRESVLEAVIRETLEETAHVFTPDALLGVYQYEAVEGTTYIRFAFTGGVGPPLPGRALDHGILRAVWLTREETASLGGRLRSPLVMQCIDDYLAGHRYPLALLYRHPG